MTPRHSVQPFARAALAISLVATVGCEEQLDLPPLEYSSELTRVGVDSGESMCAGDLAFLDAHVRRIEERIGVEARPPIDIYLFRVGETSACQGSPFGCYKPEEDIIVSAWQFIDHELVHAVAQDVPFPSLFWSEGAAEVFRVRGTRRNETRRLVAEDLNEHRDVDYYSAGHFSRYLVEEYGWEPYRDLIHAEPFEEVYGRSDSDLVSEFVSRAPYAYPPHDPCPHPVLSAVAGEVDHWNEELSFSCDSQGSTQFEGGFGSAGPGAAQFRTVTLQSGQYELSLLGGEHVIVAGCQLAELEAPPAMPSNGDVANLAEFNQTAVGTLFASGSPHTVNLTAGTYRLQISSGTEDLATLSLDLRRVDG